MEKLVGANHLHFTPSTCNQQLINVEVLLFVRLSPPKYINRIAPRLTKFDCLSVRCWDVAGVIDCPSIRCQYYSLGGEQIQVGFERVRAKETAAGSSNHGDITSPQSPKQESRDRGFKRTLV